ncbi:hypothetical protein [Microbacterium sp. HJ5]
MTSPDTPPLPEPTPVHADAVRSEALSAALAAGDEAQIGRALRMDLVVVPVLRGADGGPQIRVFQPEGGGVELMLFSSSAAFAAFLTDDPTREFDVRRGGDLAGFLQEHRTAIARVVFDPAGPHAVAAPVGAVIEALRPRATDDHVAWVTGGPQETAAVVDFRLDLPLSGWDREVPADLGARHSRAAARLVKRLSRAAPPPHRTAVADWATGLVREWSADPGAREIAAHATGRGDDALSLLALRSWQPGALAPGGEAERALSGQRDGSVAFDAGGRVPGVRTVRRTPAPALAGGMALVVDYWLPFPDGGGVCLLRFAAPHVDRDGELVALCEPVVANGRWVERSGPVS